MYDLFSASSLEVLRLQDISNGDDHVDLQCIVKTCGNPTIHWLYYANITDLLTSNLVSLSGSSQRRNKCQIEYRLQTEFKPGVYVCEPRVGESYAYQVIKLGKLRLSTSSSNLPTYILPGWISLNHTTTRIILSTHRNCMTRLNTS